MKKKKTKKIAHTVVSLSTFCVYALGMGMDAGTRCEFMNTFCFQLQTKTLRFALIEFDIFALYNFTIEKYEINLLRKDTATFVPLYIVDTK